MNIASEAAPPSQELRGLNLTRRVRSLLSGRRGLVVLAIVILSAALAFNWGWLVAIGIAPLIVAFAPCAAMCALGLCMSRMGNKSCSTKSPSAAPTAQEQTPAAAAPLERTRTNDPTSSRTPR